MSAATGRGPGGLASCVARGGDVARGFARRVDERRWMPLVRTPTGFSLLAEGETLEAGLRAGACHFRAPRDRVWLVEIRPHHLRA